MRSREWRSWPLRVPAWRLVDRPRLTVSLLRHPIGDGHWGAWLTPQPSWPGWTWIGCLGAFGIAIHRRRPTLLDYFRPLGWHLLRNAALAALSAIPGVRAHVLHTTPIKDHPMFGTMMRAERAVATSREEK